MFDNTICQGVQSLSLQSATEDIKIAGDQTLPLSDSLVNHLVLHSAESSAYGSLRYNGVSYGTVQKQGQALLAIRMTGGNRFFCLVCRTSLEM